MYRISGSGCPDIRPFFRIRFRLRPKRYQISQRDSARSFLAVSSPIMGWTCDFWLLNSDRLIILIDLLWIVTVWLNTLTAKSGNAMLEWVHLNIKELLSHVDRFTYISCRPMQCVSTQSWKHTQRIIHFLFVPQSKPKKSLLCNKYPDIRFWFRPDSSFDIRYYPVPAGFQKLLSGTSLTIIQQLIRCCNMSIKSLQGRR